MASEKTPVFVRAPSNSDEKDFEIKDTVTVFNGAMIYCGRHPAPRFL
jgi:hypothetical protein